MTPLDAVRKERAELLHYWIRERYSVMIRKDGGMPKPWSEDPVFQTTYFCNVHREDDRVTRWIRRELSPQEVGRVNYEFVMILARFLNWPDTLAFIKDVIRARPFPDDPGFASQWFNTLKKDLEFRALGGFKVWGNAYVITSHGMKMTKIYYLCHHLLPDALAALPALRAAAEAPLAPVLSPYDPATGAGATHGTGTCEAVYKALQTVPGIGSFLAAQVIADLKNTREHELYTAPDKDTFVAHGPGSIKGLSWYFYGSPEGVTERSFYPHFQLLREEFDREYDWGTDTPFPRPDNQDLQNCLCEFDKYMRVRSGTGRSKRQYPGV